MARLARAIPFILLSTLVLLGCNNGGKVDLLDGSSKKPASKSNTGLTQQIFGSLNMTAPGGFHGAVVGGQIESKTISGGGNKIIVGNTAVTE